MIANWIAGTARAIALALVVLPLGLAALAAPAPQPTANAVILAKQIIAAKGGTAIYEPVIPNVIERAKGTFLQMNPMIARDLNEVAAKLRTELTPRIVELLDEAARLYATRFTEQELKDALAFYRSPLGKKIIVEEPMVLDQSIRSAETWAAKFGEEVMVKFRAEMKRKGHDL
jgi:hypothetical protein